MPDSAPTFPPPATSGGRAWTTLPPEQAGFDPSALAEAVAFAAAHETPWPRDLRALMARGHFDPPPFNQPVGPVHPRGPANGLVLRHGHRVAVWGDTRQVDQTFSVAKSYLSLLAGLAWGDGLIRDLDEPVSRTVRDPAFAGPRNGAVTWRHLLTLTSEWEGELFGKSERIDRGRDLGAEGRKDPDRPLQAPGTHWEYNDVRVNALGLALLHRFGRPLPEVFAERIMGPIGASADWRWEGYETSWVTLADGRRVQSVPGGTHWGGGVSIHAEDQARIGLLALHRGRWEGRELLPAAWFDLATTPCPLNRNYGFLWWLNAAGRFPAAAPDAFCAVGAGGNLTWIEPSSGLVVVARWLDPAAQEGFMRRLRAALRS
ncbi:serine hydrolase [Caldovatus sediminis]|uniref:Serine hydrolase n=1 Tax=Caldovatus sediminis TaxID=2041189 RepID=A0A8J2ZAV5_9PROT|nr:serine hydrolase [Caldovatus sediminis]GGG29166.1 serine hydrolase [Caldovatus sediminis]